MLRVEKKQFSMWDDQYDNVYINSKITQSGKTHIVEEWKGNGRKRQPGDAVCLWKEKGESRMKEGCEEAPAFPLSLFLWFCFLSVKS